MNLYRTKSQGAAACLRYCFGPSSHLKTFVERNRRGETFLFADEGGECAEIERRYFAGDFAIADARNLIECFFAVKRTLTAAFNNGGVWENRRIDGDN